MILCAIWNFCAARALWTSRASSPTDGLWASKLRLDQPVLIAEAIRQRALPSEDPVLVASLVALFVDDRERDVEPPHLTPRLKKSLGSLRQTLNPMLERLRQWGFRHAAHAPDRGRGRVLLGLGAEFNDVVA